MISQDEGYQPNVSKKLKVRQADSYQFSVVQVITCLSRCLYSSISHVDVVSNTVPHMVIDKNGQKDVTDTKNDRDSVTFFLSTQFDVDPHHNQTQEGGGA